MFHLTKCYEGLARFALRHNFTTLLDGLLNFGDLSVTRGTPSSR